MIYDVAIIGGGVCGAATAYTLAQYDARVCLVEAKSDVAMGTTRANSAIIHAGYDAPSGTLMAESNVRGNELAGEICERLGVHFKRVGSLVVALSDEDMATLEALRQRGEKNGVKGLKILSAGETLEREPRLNPELKGALCAPSAGIINPWQYCIAMSNFAFYNGVDFYLDSPVSAIEKTPYGLKISAGINGIEARYVVNAAGLHSDEVHALAGGKGFKTKAVRGEYYLLDKADGGFVNSVVFPCPSKVGKGVLVAPTVHGNLIVGPNAEDVGDPDDVATTLTGQEQVRELASRTCPGIPFRDNIRNFAGNRAYIDSTDDFLVEESGEVKGFINMAGIKSPGLSAAPALAERVAGLLGGMGLALKRKDKIKDYVFPKLYRDCDKAGREALYKENDAYGRVICRCETITEGDIVKALSDGFTPPTISAIKRRCNAGMGRCQGGFCSMRVHEIIARERGISPEEVTLDGAGSYIVTGDTKED